MAEIIQVAGSLSGRQGGPSTAALGLGDTLGSRLFSVDAHLTATERNELEASEVQIFPRLFSESLQFSPRLLLALWRAAPTSTLVVFHGLMMVNTMLGAAICLLRHVDYAVQPHGGLESYQLRHHHIRKWILRPPFRFLLKRARLVACASQSEATEVQSYVRGANIVVVGMGVALDPTQPVRSLTDDAISIGFIGRFARKKRLDLVIKGCQRLSRTRDGVRLVIAGEDGDFSASQVAGMLAEAPTLGSSLSGPVRGRAKEDFWSSIDILLLPSDNENFGIVIAEAAAHAVPVVATRHVAAQHIVVEAGAGLFCEQDAESIASALRELSRNDAYAEASTRCLKVANAEFSWTRVGHRWIHAAEHAS